MPKLTSNDPAARGIYRRKNTYWLRHNVDGVQEFDNLHVKVPHFADAVLAAEKIRGKRTPGKTSRTPWSAAIQRYISDKLSGVKPAHLHGTRGGSFSESTADRTRGILEVFAARCGAATPQRVTMDHLEKYYKERRKKSEASAQTIINRVQAFLAHLNCCPGRVQFPSDAKKERRLVTVTLETSNAIIEKAPTDKLKFILYCGFHCGLRRNEIVHARPQWFDLDRRVLTVPGKEEQKLADGSVYQWRSKDKETREIPLSSDFTNFLQSHLKRDALFILEPNRCSKRYRYDIRRTLENHFANCGRGDVCCHAMRHSFISNLCNSSNHEITDISAWSGDTIEVIERNYWHKRVQTGALDETMRGKRRDDTLKGVLVQLEKLEGLALSKEEARALKTLKDGAARWDVANWKWSDAVTRRHQELYSIEETVNSMASFQLLLGEDPENAVSEFEWNEGGLASTRLRLSLLHKLGYLEPLVV